MKKQFTIFLLFTFAFLIFTLPAYAQTTCPISTSSNTVVNGLVTAPYPGTNRIVSSSGACAIDPKTQFNTDVVPTFDSLKSLYYDRLKSPLISKNQATNPGLAVTQNAINSIACLNYHDKVYSIQNDLTITSTDGPIKGTQTKQVFVDGNLNINNNIVYGSAQSGLVFVVKGDVIIDRSVTQIDAVIISQGTIYTAGKPCSLPLTTDPGTNTQLVINGSLISLDAVKPPRFCRKLADNTLPAELVNHQIKYLVILRNLFSENVQKWSEIDASVPLPSPGVVTPSENTTPPLPPEAGCNYCGINSTAVQTYTNDCGGSVTCPTNYPSNTCFINSTDCPASDTCYTATDKICSTGNTCGQTGHCPANNPTPLSSCNFCGGTTTYKDSSCVTQNCPANYTDSTCSTGSVDCPTSACHGASDTNYRCYPGNTCGIKSGYCPSTYLNQGFCDTTSCHLAYNYTGPNSCVANNLTCPATNPKPLSSCDYCGISGTAVTTYYDSACALKNCSPNYPASTCTLGTTDCPSDLCYSATARTCYDHTSCTKAGHCPANNPTPSSSCNYCGGTTTYYDASCVSQTCSTNYTASTCTVGSVDCPSNSCYVVSSRACYPGNTCGVKSGTCPANNPDTSCNYCAGDTTYYSSSCASTACSANYLNSGTTTCTTSSSDCPASTCNTGTTANQCIPANSCTKTGSCPANNPKLLSSCDYCGGKTTYYDSACTSQNCSTNYPSASCTTGTTDCPSNLCYLASSRACYTGSACTRTGTCPSNNPDTSCNFCAGDTTYYNSSCTSTNCDPNYTASTCYTGSADCPNNLCYLTSSRSCYPGNTCGTKTGTCPSNNPDTSCNYCAGDTTYYDASCASQACQTNYTAGTCTTGTVDCPSSACHGGSDGNYTCYPGNTCSVKSGYCPSTYLTQGSCTTDCHAAYAYTGASSCTANNLSCASTIANYYPAGSCTTTCHGAYNYNSGSVCSSNDATCASTTANYPEYSCATSCNTNRIDNVANGSCGTKTCYGKVNCTTGKNLDGTCTVGSIINLSTQSCSGRATPDAVSTYLTTAASAGSDQITVASNSGLNNGDEILIMRMVYSSYTSTTIVKETHTVYSTGTTITLERPLDFPYPANQTQVIRIPNYSDVNINAGTITIDGWDGLRGGVLWVRATGTVSIAAGASINLSSKGYRGGTNGSGGEGLSGIGPGPCTASGNGGSGAKNSSGTCGAAGGAGPLTNGPIDIGLLGGTGGGCQTNAQPEYAGTAPGTPYTMGAGGGSSSTSTPGGAGGGVLVVGANTITNNGTIYSNGKNVSPNPSVCCGNLNFGGGGGGGGYVLLSSGSTTVGSIITNGGYGGAHYDESDCGTEQGRDGQNGGAGYHSP